MRFSSERNIRPLLIVYVATLFIVALFTLILTWFPDFFNTYTIYPLVLNLNNLKSQLACIVIPISTGIVLLLTLTWNKKHVSRPLLVATVLAANIIACCARFTGLAVVDKQQVSIPFENHIYNVISSESDFGSDNVRWVTLYECDDHNFLCQIIFDKNVLSTAATLIPDPAAHTVTLQINGEAVYVHHPQ